MSRIATTPHETVEATPRKRLTAHQRDEVLTRQDWACAGCGVALCDYFGRTRILRPMIDEHIVPLALGGSNDLSNRELRCILCAKTKTRDDAKRIAKTKRIIRKHTEPRPPSRWRGKGFDKTRTRKFSGKVVEREK